ncbi:MAG: exosortase [Acidobacteria bacterium]|nr:exosortase [Acidobacteriota bacterium]
MKLIGHGKRYYKALTILVGLSILYWQALRELSWDWWNNPDYSHGLVLPFVAVYLIWRRKEEWSRQPVAPSNFGLLVMLGGLSLLFLGELGAEFFLTRVSLLVLLCGLVLFFLGWNHFRLAAFPIALLLLAIPLPAVIFYQITFPLQLLASHLGAFLLETSRVPVLREGNLIVLPNVTLEVVEACSGIRSLFSLLTLTVLYGYFFESRLWMRMLLIVLTVPLALFCNGLRITGTGLLTQYVDPASAESFFHGFSGWFIFVVALVSLFTIHRTLVLFGRERVTDQ